ncbi:MAG: hypothetical protein ACOYJ1_13200, partial [Peptococcales bacterium]
DYNKKRGIFYNKIQERRFTQTIKNVGIEKFFTDRIKLAEEAINRVIEENGKEESKIYTDYGLSRIIESYKNVIEVSKNVLEKTKHTKKDDLKDLSFSEILKILDNKDIELSNYYDYLPNSPATNALKMFISSMGKQDIRTSKDTKVSKKKNLTGAVEYNFKSRNSSIQLTISNYDNLVTKQDRSTRKIFNFLMQQYNLQHSKEIKFNLNDLVDRGIYKSTDTARRGLKNCMNKLTSIKVAGVIKKGNREIASTIQVLFTGMTIKNGNCIVDINEKMDIEFLAQYITLLPKWTYKLNSTAYEIIDYIFYRARQSTSDIKKQGYFNVSLDSISKHISQPDPKDTVKHSQYIIDPLLEAITEIEDTQRGKNGIKITPYYNDDYLNVHEFLKGYLKIDLSEDLKEYFIDRAKEKEKAISNNIKKIEAKI